MAAFIAWLGASLIVLADGRRGLALGVGLATAGLAVLVLQRSGPLDAGALAAGGAVASIGRLYSGAGRWEIMPAGSTARLILCIAAGLLALWLAVAVTNGSGAGLRFAVLSVAGLTGARVLSSDDQPVLLSALALLALAVGAAAGLAGTSPGAWPYLAAGAIAAGATLLPSRTPRDA